jgi:hypothetical protein
MKGGVTKWSPLAAAAFAAILTACGPKAETTQSFFPETGEAAGWTKAKETRTFEAKDLWQYIDGDDQKYLKAGVVRTQTTDYRYQDKIDAVADIYVMGAADGARKVYETESGEGSTPAPLGDGGRLYGASAVFHLGRYFVRLTAYESTPEIGKALLELGKAIEKRIGD